MTAFTDVEEQRRAEQAARERDVAQARAEELRVARRRIIEAGDAARAQLERDLHDGAQQQFVSAVLQLQLAERKALSDPDGARDLRVQAIALASGGLTELRRLASGIHPAILTDRGLGPAVQSLAARLPLSVSVVATPDVRLPAPVEASVYFFVSEALTNVVKHAQAREATVSIAAGNGGLTVEVGDDGVGGSAGSPGAVACVAWATASAPSTGRSKSGAHRAAGRCCALASRWCTDRRARAGPRRAGC